MRIAISNIAWDVAEDVSVAQVLVQHGIDAIDIAPGKYFPDPARAQTPEILALRDWWRQRGITITGMQALLFGTTGLNVFGSPSSRSALLAHLESVCRIGGTLGATRLVFGSPRNRDRSGLRDDEALEQAVAFFTALGEIASAHGVLVCLEPNPPCYGANFMTNSAETAAVVVATAHPAIRMQLDTGAAAINGESFADVVTQFAPLLAHAHASEPDLVTLGDGATDHASAAEALKAMRPDLIVSIEMLASKQQSHTAAIERALVLAKRHYGGDALAGGAEA